MNGKFESTSKKYDELNLNRFLSVPGAGGGNRCGAC
jgi:hypothetical protein